MELVCEGETQAFDEIVSRYQHVLQRFALRMLGSDASTAEDAVIGTFLRLWEIRFSYVPQDRLKTWLLRTCHRRVLNVIKTISPPSLGTPEAPCGFDTYFAVEANSLSADIQRCVSELSDPLRGVLILSVYEELDYRTISETLDIPAGTVASRRNQAVQILNRRLSSWKSHE